MLFYFNSNLTATDNTKFRFATDGEGNYGYLGADDSFIPFKKGGRLIYLGTGTSYDIKTLLPDVDYTQLTIEDFVILNTTSFSEIHFTNESYPNKWLAHAWVSVSKTASYDSSNGILSAYSSLSLKVYAADAYNSASTTGATASSIVYFKQNIEIA